MGAVCRCAAVATNAHGSSAAGEHALYAEAGPGTDAVAIRTEVPVPAVIDCEKQLCGARNIHPGEYKTGLRAGKPSEPRSGDARPARALRSDNRYLSDEHYYQAGDIAAAIAATVPELASAIADMDKGQKHKAFNASKIEAHHAIIPTTKS